MRPPDESPKEIRIAVAYCFDCHEVIGPDHSADVGEEMAFSHDRHTSWLIDEWTEEAAGSARNREAGAIVELACQLADEMTEEQIARLHRVVSDEAYERKLTFERMDELLDG